MRKQNMYYGLTSGFFRKRCVYRTSDVTVLAIFTYCTSVFFKSFTSSFQLVTTMHVIIYRSLFYVTIHQEIEAQVAVFFARLNEVFLL